MKIGKVKGKLYPGIDTAKLERLIEELPLGAAYQQLLKISDGIEFESSAILYRAKNLLERNATFEVPKYAPSMIAIGDDGGGQLILIDKGLPTSPVYIIGAGALGSLTPAVLSGTIEEWIERGFPVKCRDETTIESEFADVYLVSLPADGLKSLVEIKKRLGLETSIVALRQGAKSLPSLLLKGVPRGKYSKRCESINRELGNCLSVKDSF